MQSFSRNVPMTKVKLHGLMKELQEAGSALQRNWFGSLLRITAESLIPLLIRSWYLMQLIAAWPSATPGHWCTWQPMQGCKSPKLRTLRKACQKTRHPHELRLANIICVFVVLLHLSAGNEAEAKDYRSGKVHQNCYKYLPLTRSVSEARLRWITEACPVINHASSIQ